MRSPVIASIAVVAVCSASCSKKHPQPAVVTCAVLAPLSTGVCEVTPGNGAELLVGDVLGAGTTFLGGQVAISAAGTIACVGCDCASEAGAGATRVSCPRGVISPGLINTHDHLTYTQNDPLPDSGERYEQRVDWAAGLRGHTQIAPPETGLQDQVTWGELRFLMGGATSTVGVGTGLGFLRNLDSFAQEGLDQTEVGLDTFPLGDKDGPQLSSGCAYPAMVTPAVLDGRDAYEPHIAEGIDDTARNEFVCLSSGAHDIVHSKTAIIHGTALLADDFRTMKERGAKLIWSPRSNVSLYGDTASVALADRLGVEIALGSDWLPTGSMNLLRELRCADDWNRDRLAGHFSDEQLWKMVTANAADLTATNDVIGSLQKGKIADVAIFDGSAHAGFRAVIDAGAADVTLVLRGGKPLYGDEGVMSALVSPAAACDAIDVCGTAKSLCALDEVGKTFADLQNGAGTIYPLFFCSAPASEPTCTPSRTLSVSGSTTYTGAITAADADGDGVSDATDDCPDVFNPVRPLDGGAQADSDGDGLGDACDPSP